jgi:hypothetical protein
VARGDDMDWGKLFCSDKVTVAEFAAILVFLVHSNVPFEIIFEPRNQLEFATLRLEIAINPRMITSLEITLTDR